MTVRVGHIEFLNCYPLYHGLERRAAAGHSTRASFELVPGVPTDLNRMLVSGTIDFGPISSIAYARNHRQLLLSERLSISSRGAVDSIQLVSTRPLEELERVALTPKSATSVALLKTLLKLRYDREPVYDELVGAPADAIRDHDAVLLIGDEALQALYFPAVEAECHDLGRLWRGWTGVPMVYAVWATRRDYYMRHAAELLEVEEELVSSIAASRDGMADVVDSALGLWPFDRPCLDRYFEALKFGFGEDYQRGLRRFYELALEAGELTEAPDLAFFPVGHAKDAS
ncbi:MAG: menaquinone biosynthetic enzyme MqnA/MqnD family protein [Thermoleophilia bacterium]